jgi:hypothetical protein
MNEFGLFASHVIFPRWHNDKMVCAECLDRRVPSWDFMSASLARVKLSVVFSVRVWQMILKWKARASKIVKFVNAEIRRNVASFEEYLSYLLIVFSESTDYFAPQRCLSPSFTLTNFT